MISAAKLERKQVGIISHSIIYRLLEDVTAQLASQLQPEIKQKVLGEAVVREIFDFTVKSKKSAKKISIAGSRVTNGRLSKKSLVRACAIKRLSSVVTFPLLNISKRRSRKSKRTLTVGGITFEGWADFQPGDVIQTYEEIEVPRYL